MQFTALVPATTSNLGPGFDSLGMALNLCNEFRCEAVGDHIEVRLEGEGADLLPAGPQNLVVRTLQRFCEAHGQRAPDGLRFVLQGNVPVSGGLGSSATATVGGTLLACGMMGLPTDEPEIRQRILAFATETEGHPDNAAVVAATADGQVHSMQLAPPTELACVLATPAMQQSTNELRAALPDRVSMTDAVFNLSHTGLLVAALCHGRLDLLRVAMRDRIHQHVRTAGIPGFDTVVQSAQDAGALATVLSGAGATVIAYVDRGDDIGDAVGAAMSSAFAAAGIGCVVRTATPRANGAELLVKE